MKKYLFLIFSLFLFSSNFPPSAGIVVSGIIEPSDMNGIYTQMGTWQGRPYFERHSGMNTYSIFYYDNGTGSGWTIYPDRGQYDMMWFPWHANFHRDGTEPFPPSSGYSPQGGMSMISVSGDPYVQNPSAIPVSLWGVVLIFFLIGGTLIFRYYKKRSQIV